MKIILLCSSQSNQVALANKVAAKYPLAGIVIEKKITSGKKLSFQKIVNRLTDFLFFKKILNAWFLMLKNYSTQYPEFPVADLLYTTSINNDEVKKFITDIRPDLLIVSGTTLLKKKILEIPVPFGILNLHTGLSPYIKGAPNCTNWCIANGDFHLIGNTTMWIDAGIDSGDIVATGVTPFTGEEDLRTIHFKVMEHAHELYLSTIDTVLQGKAARVKQNSIAEGSTYYSKDWGFSAKWKLLGNLKKFKTQVNSDHYKKLQDNLVLVK